jgi:predicted kinase
MKRQSIVYLICGFIGAGKTTLAKKLEKETGAVRITKDEWSIRLIGNDPTIDGYAEWDQKIIGLSRDFAFHLAEKGIDVIMDEGFWAKEEREDLKRRIHAIGAKAVMYYVDTPIEKQYGKESREETTISRKTRLRLAEKCWTIIWSIGNLLVKMKITSSPSEVR